MRILAQTSNAQQDVTPDRRLVHQQPEGRQGHLGRLCWRMPVPSLHPVLTSLFNTIIDAWPIIAPMLMQLVDLLGDGLSDAVPILIQLGTDLLPIFCDALG